MFVMCLTFSTGQANIINRKSTLVFAGFCCIAGFIVGTQFNSSQLPTVATAASAASPQTAGDDSKSATSEDTVSPVKARERETYYPNTEDLRPDEMRVIACGTGMPTTRAAQAAACFLVELGNGDKFLFDCGSGAAERISPLQIPYNYLDKVFIGHLHTDHFGSLHDLFIGGALMG